MSASSKKKLRSEASAGKMTERQTAEKKEAAKLKLYTALFAVVLAVLVVIAVWVGASRTIDGSGILQRKTTAVTIGSHEVSNAELSYFYIDAVNNFRSQYGSYAFLYGMDTSTPLDEQFYDEEAGMTWADYFMQSAISNAQANYAMVDAAKAEGFALTEEQENEVNILASNLDTYATLSGAQNTNQYVKAMYGNGATRDGYLEYYRNNILANAYYNAHQDSLAFSADEIKAESSENATAYNAYTFHQYYLSTSKFLTGGTTDAEGNTTYSDEENAAAQIAAEAAAKELASQTYASAEEFNAAIAALSVNADSSASSTPYTNASYSSLNSRVSGWVSDSARKEGDVTSIESASTTTAEDGTETTTVSGYYVVYFVNATDNSFPLVNVRHILVTPEGGTTDANGSITYTDEEKAAAKASAEELLAQWKSGDATEDSFAQLANENSTDGGSNTNGGLYENVYPGQMVPTFNDWCFDAARASGDTGIVETDYGFHVMYFVGTSDTTYRDYQITNALRSNAMESWYLEKVEALTVVDGNAKYIATDLVMGTSN